MKKTTAFLTIVVLFTFFSCQKEEIDASKNEYQEIQIDEKSAQIIEADNTFGFELFQHVYTSETEYENIMISPLSVSLALAMTYNGAKGETKTAMEETLKLHGLTPEEINTSYQTLLAALKSLDSKVLLEIANAIYYRNNFPVEQDFINTNENYYDAEVSALDFTATGVVDIINNWVADKTKNKIKSIVDEIKENQIMFLLNAIYFKGIWESEFDKKNTEKKDFYLEDGTTIQTDFMQQTNSVFYTSNELFEAIQLPYGQGNFNMYVFLPQTDKTLQDLAENMNKGNWDLWRESFTETNADIEFPKFKYEYEIKLNDVLSEMGMEIAFSPDYADFKGINSGGGLYIDFVKHKSFIEVNEEGTEAAAVTAVAIAYRTTGTGNSTIPFYANKPFLFAITEKSTGAVLFMGTVKNPVYE
ncbi:serpin family protein [Maribellus maritimus]|uniref:serpin family protein n=1 Tax=Maribellus maritimus TaxID=2870838 RepID=UPI001EEC1977|nr:serpin family protein [Maribellus maritimus]MCG6186056.1 serpin family protein [Maribellus maritimus]